MRIRFVTLYFPPEVGAAQRRISELTRRLAACGHTVTVVTGFPNYPSGEKPPSYRGRFFMKERTDAVTVIRLPHFVAANKGFFKRLLIHLTFALSAGIYTLFMKRDDIVYVESPPLFNGFVGLVSKWFRGIPYFFNVADLWPQTAIELGALTNKWAIMTAQALEKLFYYQARKILAVTVGIQKFICNLGFPGDKVPVVTNGVDHLLFTDTTPPDEVILGLRKPGRRLALYAGTLGMAHALQAILGAADRLREEPLDFLFIGDGAEKESLVNEAGLRRLANVTFLEAIPQVRMPAVLRAADFSIISLRNLPLFDSAMPSKCFESMAAGLPVMLAVRGEMADHIRLARCGFCAEPEDVDQITTALRRFVAIEEQELREMGRRGRAYAAQNFSREKITERLERLMREATGHER